MKRIVVIGLGNVLLTDEGVGVHVVNRIEALHGEFPDVEFVDAGAAGMKLLHIIPGRQKAILVDCALMDEPPGTLRRFLPDQVRSIKALAGLSMHEGDLLSIIRLCGELGDIPEEVVILGIEPDIVEPGQEVSDCLAERMDEYVAAVRAEIGASQRQRA